MKACRLPRLFALLAVCSCCFQGTARAEAPDDVAAWMRDLDDDRFAVRQRAERRLLDLGAAALPRLQAARGGDSAEARRRAERICQTIKRRGVLRDFRRLSEQTDREIDLEQGMWLIGRVIDPACDRAACDRRLDELAARVRARLSGDLPPRLADPRDVVAAVRQVLFVEEGFTGNVADYQNPGNSSLAQVLETRRGLPILLSHVVVAVGKRLDVPLVGIPIPKRYMLKYDGRRAPPGYPQDDIIVNAFDSGRVLTRTELERVAVELGVVLDYERYLRPDGRRAALDRMLKNLIEDLEFSGCLEEAQLAEECQSLLDYDAAAVTLNGFAMEKAAARLAPMLERINRAKR